MSSEAAAAAAPAAFEPRAFVAGVREAFARQPESVATFESIMRELNAGRGSATAAECLPLLGALLAPHPQLIELLNGSLPEAFRIDPRQPGAPLPASSPAHYELPWREAPRAVVDVPRAASAHAFLRRVSERLGDQQYRAFLAAFRALRADGSVYDDVAAMLSGHADIGAEFVSRCPAFLFRREAARGIG